MGGLDTHVTISMQLIHNDGACMEIETAREKHQAANRRWRENNLEKVRERQREANRRWRANNPEKYKECYTKQNRKTFERDPEAYRKKRRDYAAANPEKVKARNEIWRKKNRKHVNEYRMRQHYILNYGITIEEKECMLEAQGNKCACCGSPDPKYKPGWVVDHCHETGKVRAILCQPCNLVLGKVKESKEHLRNLIAYLEIHSDNN